jgi:ribosomal protein S6--L-glutamate ligase
MVRIAFLLKAEGADGQPRVSGVTGEVIGRLRERGALVDLLVPDAEPFDLADVRCAHDLYVLKEKTPLIMGFAAALTVAGATVVNSVRSQNLTRDKVAATAVLAGAGVLVPPSWATGDPSRVASLVADGPVWVKAARGSRGAGVSRVTDATALDLAPHVRDVYGLPLPLFAQREVPSRGRDLKVFVVGEEMWATARVFPARTIEEKLGTPVAVGPDVRKAALACGQALGLELYGVDFLEDEDRLWAVDVNALPGYKGAPEAPRALADYLYHRAVCAGNGGSE